MNENETISEEGLGKNKNSSGKRTHFGPVVLSGKEFVEATRRFPGMKIRHFIEAMQKKND